MKKTFAMILALFVVASAFGQKQAEMTKKTMPAKVEIKGTKMHGYVVDQMCAKSMAKKGSPMDKAAKHTKECALEEACAASGFGLFYEDGKWIKFDEKGDAMAKAMFEKSKKEKEFMADVVGEMKDGKLLVASLVESTMGADEMKGKPVKKEDAHEAHDHK